MTRLLINSSKEVWTISSVWLFKIFCWLLRWITSYKRWDLSAITIKKQPLDGLFIVKTQSGDFSRYLCPRTQTFMTFSIDFSNIWQSGLGLSPSVFPPTETQTGFAIKNCFLIIRLLTASFWSYDMPSKLPIWKAWTSKKTPSFKNF